MVKSEYNYENIIRVGVDRVNNGKNDRKIFQNLKYRIISLYVVGNTPGS